MRIQELLIENQKINEGPKWNKFGQAVGNVAGMAAKGVGAVAGGIAGLGAAAKKGFQAGKSQVAAADDQPATTGAAPTPGAPVTPPPPGKTTIGKAAPGAPTGTAPVGGAAAGAAGKKSTAPGAAPTGKGFVAGVQAGLSKGISALKDPSLEPGSPKAAAGGEEPDVGTDAQPSGGAPAGAAPVAKKATPKTPAGAAPAGAAPAGAAPAPTPAAAAANQTMYSQVKANIDKLDAKGKQRILQLLQKSISTPTAKAAPAAGAPTAKAAPVAGKPAAPVTPPTKAAPVTPPPPAAPTAPTKPAAGATTTAPSGEKVIANPVATVGTKRATNIGEPTFDKQTGKALPGQSLNAIRKKAEYGSGALGAARKRIKAGAAQTQTASKINTGSLVLEGFNLFRKK